LLSVQIKDVFLSALLILYHLLYYRTYKCILCCYVTRQLLQCITTTALQEQFAFYFYWHIVYN